MTLPGPKALAKLRDLEARTVAALAKARAKLAAADPASPAHKMQSALVEQLAETVAIMERDRSTASGQQLDAKRPKP